MVKHAAARADGITVSVVTLSRLPRVGVLQLAHARTAHLLAGLVAVSFLGRLLGAWTRATPTFFPDEYLYAELGRSIADGGLPLVRGVASGFPSLLHPLLTAPIWLIDDVETAFRAVQALDAAVMSLAALPAYGIARQLGIGRNLSVAVAAAALVGPDLLLAGWLVAEPLAYPLVLASIWALLRAIEQPTLGSQSLLLSLLALTTLARVQLAVVPLCALATIVLLGVRERCLARVLREQWLVLACTGVLLATGGALLATGRLGVYSGLLELDLDPVGVAGWVGPTALLVVYAAGWVVVPGALAGIVVALARPATRRESALAIHSVLLALALLAEAGFISDSITGDLHERYVFYLGPLVFVWFARWLNRGLPAPRLHAAVALGLGAAAVWAPVSRYSTGTGKTDAPTLRAVGGLESLLGDPGAASALVAATCVVGAIIVVAARRRGAEAMRWVLAGAIVLSIAASALATSFDHGNSLRVKRDFVGAGNSWIDRLGAADATLLWGGEGRPASAHEALFWNRSVATVGLLPDADAFDDWASERVEIGADGALALAGAPVDGWLLVDRFAGSPEFTGGVALGGTPDLALYRFDDTGARLASLFGGRYHDGFLSGRGTLRVWPVPGESGIAGTVSFTARAPAEGPDRTLELRVAGTDAGPAGSEEPIVVAVRAGSERHIALTACSPAGPWELDYHATPGTGDGTRSITVEASPVAYVPSPSLCAGPGG